MNSPYTEEELIFLFNNENKTTLLDIYFNPIKNFVAQNKEGYLDSHFANELLLAINKKANVTKYDMVFLCSKIYSSKELLVKFTESLSVINKKIFIKGIWQPEINARELKEIYKCNFYDVSEYKNTYDYRSKFNIHLIKDLESWNAYIKNNINELRYIYDINKFKEGLKVWIAFPQLKRMIYSSVLEKPEGYELQEATLSENVITFSYEQKIFQEFPLLVAYHLQKKIQYTQKGVPSLPSVRKMAKTVNIEKFPLKQGDELRNMMLTGLLSEKFKYNALKDTPLSALRQLFSSAKITKKMLSPIILPNLKGMNRLNEYDYRYRVAQDIIETIKLLPIDTWISKENLTIFVHTHFIDLDVISSYNLGNVQNTFKEPDRYGSILLTESEMDQAVYWPNFYGYFYLFAAFGLMEIAINKDVKLRDSYYDDFEACKLTKLGAYVLNQLEEYKMPELSESLNLIFEEDSLFIRVEGDIELATVIIGNYVSKISDNKFQFSSEVFLKDCKTTQSIEDKINIFKTAVGKKLPDYWLNHLENLVVNSEIIHQNNNLIVFKIPSENKDLIKIIAQDAELKKIIIKAEQFYILVERKNYGAFISRMKHFGILINP